MTRTEKLAMIRAATMPLTCDAGCGPPTCAGAYEDPEAPLGFGCDVCCGHGNEDGWCERLEEVVQEIFEPRGTPVPAPRAPAPPGAHRRSS